MGDLVASPQSRGQGGLCGQTALFLPLGSPSYPASINLGSICNPALASEEQVDIAGGSLRKPSQEDITTFPGPLSISPLPSSFLPRLCEYDSWGIGRCSSMRRRGLVSRLWVTVGNSPDFSLTDHAAFWAPDVCVVDKQLVDYQWNCWLPWNSWVDCITACLPCEYCRSVSCP